MRAAAEGQTAGRVLSGMGQLGQTPDTLPQRQPRVGTGIAHEYVSAVVCSLRMSTAHPASEAWPSFTAGAAPRRVQPSRRALTPVGI